MRVLTTVSRRSHLLVARLATSRIGDSQNPRAHSALKMGSGFFMEVLAGKRLADFAVTVLVPLLGNNDSRPYHGHNTEMWRFRRRVLAQIAISRRVSGHFDVCLATTPSTWAGSTTSTRPPHKPAIYLVPSCRFRTPRQAISYCTLSQMIPFASDDCQWQKKRDRGPSL